jgi:hypothetical protein
MARHTTHTQSIIHVRDELNVQCWGEHRESSRLWPPSGMSVMQMDIGARGVQQHERACQRGPFTRRLVYSTIANKTGRKICPKAVCPFVFD